MEKGKRRSTFFVLCDKCKQCKLNIEKPLKYNRHNNRYRKRDSSRIEQDE